MPWARNDPEELWYGIEKVENLRNKEQKHGLAEMAQDSHHGERHPRKVAERIPDEYLRGVPEKKSRYQGIGSGLL